MAGRDQSKEASLAASRTLNPHPEGVTDPAFTSGAFFDPADLVQVKYEMVRAVEAGGLGAGAAASAFGLARQSYYNARKTLAERGLAGLIPPLKRSLLSLLPPPPPPPPGPEGRAQADGGGGGLPGAAARCRRSRAVLGAAGRSGRGPVRRHRAQTIGRARARRPARRREPSAGGGQKPLAPCPQGRTRAPLRSLAPMSSCAVSPPAGSAAAGDTGQRYWPPRGWRPGWPPRPRGPPIARPQTGVTARQRKRRPNGPHPPPTSPCPRSRRKEVRTPARPARRCRPPPPAS
jgi:hypothetical protein